MSVLLYYHCGRFTLYCLAVLETSYYNNIINTMDIRALLLRNYFCHFFHIKTTWYILNVNCNVLSWHFDHYYKYNYKPLTYLITIIMSIHGDCFCLYFMMWQVKLYHNRCKLRPSVSWRRGVKSGKIIKFNKYEFVKGKGWQGLWNHLNIQTVNEKLIVVWLWESKIRRLSHSNEAITQ